LRYFVQNKRKMFWLIFIFYLSFVQHCIKEVQIHHWKFGMQCESYIHNDRFIKNNKRWVIDESVTNSLFAKYVVLRFTCPLCFLLYVFKTVNVCVQLVRGCVRERERETCKCLNQRSRKVCCTMPIDEVLPHCSSRKGMPKIKDVEFLELPAWSENVSGEVQPASATFSILGRSFGLLQV